jgi:surface antigen
VNRTVGLTLRRTAGGGVIFALGFGAVSAGPHQVVAVSAAPAAVPQILPVRDDDLVVPRPPRTVAILYTEAVATPTPTPAPVQQPAVAARRSTAARVPAGPSWSAGPVSGASNGFTYGYCTWWVAHKRYVPWRGNAAQWWWNARPFGYVEGSVPRPGAIMVMGYSRSSPQGHVAYVESVNANGSFLVSEMNWWGVPGGGWGRVDYRTVSSMSGVLGFIY